MVNLKNCSVGRFTKYAEGRKVYAFGAGEMMNMFCTEICEQEIERVLFAFTDNDASRHGSAYVIKDRSFPIISVDDLIKRIDIENDIILITPYFHYPYIVEQLDKITELNGVDCFILAYINECHESEDESVDASGLQHKIAAAKKEAQQIPKKIHYIWFGKKDIPYDMEICMESWGKFCPDYEIIKWSEDNYDVAKSNYLKSAYAAGRFSKVSNFARLDILFQHGGIYLDTDIELVKPLDDLLYHQAFAGFSYKHFIELGVGFGGKPGFGLFKTFMDIYGDEPYFDGHQDVYMNKRQNFLHSLGFIPNGTFQVVGGLSIYPTEFFSPINRATGILSITENTYSVHNFAGTWIDDERDSRRMLFEFYDKYKDRITAI